MFTCISNFDGVKGFSNGKVSYRVIKDMGDVVDGKFVFRFYIKFDNGVESELYTTVAKARTAAERFLAAA